MSRFQKQIAPFLLDTPTNLENSPKHLPHIPQLPSKFSHDGYAIILPPQGSASDNGYAIILHLLVSIASNDSYTAPFCFFVEASPVCSAQGFNDQGASLIALLPLS